MFQCEQKENKWLHVKPKHKNRWPWLQFCKSHVYSYYSWGYPLRLSVFTNKFICSIVSDIFFKQIAFTPQHYILLVRWPWPVLKRDCHASEVSYLPNWDQYCLRSARRIKPRTMWHWAPRLACECFRFTVNTSGAISFSPWSYVLVHCLYNKPTWNAIKRLAAVTYLYQRNFCAAKYQYSINTIGLSETLSRYYQQITGTEIAIKAKIAYACKMYRTFQNSVKHNMFYFYTHVTGFGGCETMEKTVPLWKKVRREITTFAECISSTLHWLHQAGLEQEKYQL